MGVFENLPYTNFHETNLAWLLSEWKKQAGEFEDIKSAFTDLKSFVDDYFDDLDVQDEINAKLDAMFSSGELTDILMEAITVYESGFQRQLDTMSARIDEITNLPDGSTSGDAELTDIRIGWRGKVYSTAGNAVRGQVTELERSAELVAGRNEFNGYTMPSASVDGITITWPSASQMVVTGTSTAQITYNFYADDSALPGDVVPGDICTFIFDSNNNNVKAGLFYHDGSDWIEITSNINATRQFAMPASARGFLARINIPSGVNAGAVVSVALVRGCRMLDLYSGAFPIIAGNTPNEALLIESALQKYKSVLLLPGTHYSSGFTMPEKTTLSGCGECSILHTTAAGQNGVVIRNPDCTVRDLKIVDTQGPGSDAGTTSGVYVLGDGGSTWLHHIRIINVTVTGFARAGIDGEGLGYEPTNSLTIIGCRCYGNYYGLLLANHCEYCRISDSIFTGNVDGCYNASGNNKFVGCDFSSNTQVGLLIDGNSVHGGGNVGHGSAVGCSFNHNGNNTGYGILIRNNGNGFTFTGCNFWYNMIYQSDNSTAVFVGCLIGGATSSHFSTWTGAKAFINSCIWYATPDNRGGAANIFANCYQSDGTPI